MFGVLSRVTSSCLPSAVWRNMGSPQAIRQLITRVRAVLAPQGPAEPLRAPIYVVHSEPESAEARALIDDVLRMGGKALPCQFRPNVWAIHSDSVAVQERIRQIQIRLAPRP
jgi:hypothetical protein